MKKKLLFILPTIMAFTLVVFGMSGTDFGTNFAKGLNWQYDANEKIETEEFVQIKGALDSLGSARSIEVSFDGGLTTVTYTKGELTGKWDDAKYVAAKIVAGYVTKVNNITFDVTAMSDSSSYVVYSDTLTKWNEAYTTCKLTDANIAPAITRATAAVEYVEANAFLTAATEAISSDNVATLEAAKAQGEKLGSTAPAGITAANALEAVTTAMTTIQTKIDSLNENAYKKQFADAAKTLSEVVAKPYQLGTTNKIDSAETSAYRNLMALKEAYTKLQGKSYVGETYITIGEVQYGTESIKALCDTADVMHAAAEYVKGTGFYKYGVTVDVDASDYDSLYTISTQIAAKDAQERVYINQVFNASLIETALADYKKQAETALIIKLVGKFRDNYSKVEGKVLFTNASGVLSAVPAAGVESMLPVIEEADNKYKGLLVDSLYSDILVELNDGKVLDYGRSELGESNALPEARLKYVAREVNKYVNKSGSFETSIATLWKEAKKDQAINKAFKDKFLNNAKVKDLIASTWTLKTDSTLLAKEDSAFAAVDTHVWLITNNNNAYDAELPNMNKWNWSADTIKVTTYYVAADTVSSYGKAINDSVKKKINPYKNDIIFARRYATNWMKNTLSLYNKVTAANYNITSDDIKGIQTAIDAYDDITYIASVGKKLHGDEGKAAGQAIVKPYYTKLDSILTVAKADSVSTDIDQIGILYGNGVWVDNIYGGYEGTVPTSWKAVKAIIDSVRAEAVDNDKTHRTKADSIRILPASTTGLTDSIYIHKENLKNAILFVASNNGKYAPADVANLYDNIVFIDAWTTQKGRANKLNFNSAAPYLPAIEVQANNVTMDVQVEVEKKRALYMPFNFNKAQLEKNSADLKVYYVAGVVENDVYDNSNNLIPDSVKVNFGIRQKTKDDANNVLGYAYKPYLIKGAEKSTLSFDSVTVVKAAGNLGEGTITFNGAVADYTLSSTTQRTTCPKYDYYYQAENTKTDIKEAFTHCTAKNGAALPPSQIQLHIAARPGVNYAISFTDADVENEATGIETVVSTEVKAVKGIYTINGVKVNDMSKPGLYIVNGKKVLKK